VRTVMRFQRISFVSPLGQFILATTNWAVVPLQRMLPGVGKLDLCSLIPAWLIQVLLAAIVTWAGSPLRVDPARHRVQRFGFQAAGPPLGILPPADQPGLLQHLQMFGDSG